jgi:dTDP-4-amino-4,6-dideoxygalactose transaminase
MHLLSVENIYELVKYLKENGVGVGIYYPKPLHMHKHFMDHGYKEGDFPVSEKLSKQVICLPVHPSVTEEDIKKIIDVFKEASK